MEQGIKKKRKLSLLLVKAARKVLVYFFFFLRAPKDIWRPWWLRQESACSVGDLGSIPVSGSSPGEGNGNPLQYSCLENPMDGGA